MVGARESGYAEPVLTVPDSTNLAATAVADAVFTTATVVNNISQQSLEGLFALI